MVLFFDMDDTLLDHTAAANVAVGEVYEQYRALLPWNKESFIERWNAISEKYFGPAGVARGRSIQDIRRARVLDIFDRALSDAEADEVFLVYATYYEANWSLFPDVLPNLENLREYRLGLITNGDSETQRKKINRFGLTDRFEPVLISREVGLAKPDGAIFRLAAEKAKVSPVQCVYIGDRLETDALGAQKTGMRGIWLDRKKEWAGQTLTVKVIQGLKELYPAIQA